MRIQNRSPFRPHSLKQRYKIENRADEATVYLYDEIGWFGIAADEFVRDLNSIKAGTIHLRVNSPGGSVFDGTTIYNALKQHKSKVIAHVDGLAASIASVIIMGADEVKMAENAFLMIHEPWSIVMGGSDDMRHEAELLDKVRGTIAKTYQNKSGKEEDEILAMMEKETWFTAQEAIDAGFVDSIYDQTLEKAEVTLFDLSVFSRVPEQLQQGGGMPTPRELERALKNSGCSSKQAKAILAAGYDGLQRDVADTDAKPEATMADQRDVEKPATQPKAAQRDVEEAEKPESDKPNAVECNPSHAFDANQDLILRAMTLINRTSQEDKL